MLLAPVLAAVAIAIKLDSPGPVFFVQERVGLNRRRFRLYKFRTMVADAERMQAELEPLNEADGPVFKIERRPAHHARRPLAARRPASTSCRSSSTS